jgi:hypothetical protein
VHEKSVFVKWFVREKAKKSPQIAGFFCARQKNLKKGKKSLRKGLTNGVA